MKKCYAVCNFLSDENKRQMRETASDCGYEIDFFENNDEADGKVSDGEVIYCNDPVLLGQMPGLKWCHSASAGVRSFVESGAFDGGRALLTNSSGAYGLVISEYIIMTSLMLMRRMPEYSEITQRREWKQNLAVRSIKGSHIAVIGTGDIGRNAALRYKALGAESITGFSRSGRAMDGFDAVYRIDEYEKVMAGQSFDVLLVCVPGTPESEGLLSSERIALLSDKTLVINVGRGSVIDQDALTDALNEGRIAGAALDVVYPEPLPADHPLWTARNCILTPHMSGDMGLAQTVDITTDIFCCNLRRLSENLSLKNIVDISAGY